MTLGTHLPRPTTWLTVLGCLVPAGLASQSSKHEVSPAVYRDIGRKTHRSGSRSLAGLWTRKLDRTVESGLAWLAKTQAAGGHWTGDVGHKRGGSYMVFRDQRAQIQSSQGHMGVTALAGMAFLSGGHLPNRGQYGAVVAKAIRYVVDHVAPSGLASDSGTRMYSHAFATLFLAEVYGMVRDPRVKKSLERAVHMIVDCQNSHGAWRYNPFSTAADLSVTVCQLQALRAAKNIGIEVPKSTIERAVTYVRKSQATRGRGRGLFYYKIHGPGARRKNTQFAINSAAVTALVSAGVYEKKLLAPAIDFISNESAQVMSWAPRHYYFWYGNYYASQALFHAEGVIAKDCFRRYFKAIRRHLITSQEDDGRWINDIGPGDAFATAVACVILQVPKQYLPIFQR